MTLVHMVDSARDLIKVHETGRWAHINVKLLHLVAHLEHAQNGHYLSVFGGAEEHRSTIDTFLGGGPPIIMNFYISLVSGGTKI